MIIPLPFDSELFGYPVGTSKIDDSWDEQKFLLEASDFRLVYLFSDEIVKRSNSLNVHHDTKLVFWKSLTESKQKAQLDLYQGPLTDEICKLAFLSGAKSRFKTDPFFQNQEFEKLYLIWIKKAIEKKQLLAFPQLEGMVTLEVENGHAKVGLLVVSESHQGKGLGSQLVSGAEHFAWQHGASSIEIATQERNKAAVKLYQKQGYELSSRTYIYHFWNSSYYID